MAQRINGTWLLSKHFHVLITHGCCFNAWKNVIETPDLFEFTKTLLRFGLCWLSILALIGLNTEIPVIMIDFNNKISSTISSETNTCRRVQEKSGESFQTCSCGAIQDILNSLSKATWHDIWNGDKKWPTVNSPLNFCWRLVILAHRTWHVNKFLAHPPNRKHVFTSSHIVYKNILGTVSSSPGSSRNSPQSKFPDVISRTSLSLNL